MRANTSAVPPAANVLTMRTGLDGQDCARAGAVAASSAMRIATQRFIMSPCALLLDQPGLLDHRPPGLSLPVNERPELLRAQRLGRHALLPHALTHLGLGHDVGDLAVDLAHDVVRQPGRAGKREPGDGAELRIAELLQG